MVLIGLGVFFLVARPALLPEDLRYLQRPAGDIDTAVPRLRQWLRLVFIVLGGYAVGTGTLTVYVAATAVSHGDPLAVTVLAVAGVASIGVMAVVNFVLHSAFRWLLSAFAVVWIAATLVAVLAR
ncbi:hypothetical protein MAHJHV55_23140 [Mycobacterium avium subsp. hominissuis]